MASYEIGAYEALHWAWAMLNNIHDDSDAIIDARKEIKQKLSHLGHNGDTEFLRQYAQ
jgi:hypothetical protein